MTMSMKEFQSLGGKARWKGKSKKERSEAMKKIAKMPRKKIPPPTPLQASTLRVV